MITTADVLRGAAERIEQVGLWQGLGEHHVVGTECAYTSIRAVFEETEGQESESWWDAVVALKRHLGLDSVSQVFRWNDAARSASDVTSKLRECADGLG